MNSLVVILKKLCTLMSPLLKWNFLIRDFKDMNSFTKKPTLICQRRYTSTIYIIIYLFKQVLKINSNIVRKKRLKIPNFTLKEKGPNVAQWHNTPNSSWIINAGEKLNERLIRIDWRVTSSFGLPWKREVCMGTCCMGEKMARCEWCGLIDKVMQNVVMHSRRLLCW